MQNACRSLAARFPALRRSDPSRALIFAGINFSHPLPLDVFDAMHGYVHASLYVRLISLRAKVSNVVFLFLQSTSSHERTRPDYQGREGLWSLLMAIRYKGNLRLALCSAALWPAGSEMLEPQTWDIASEYLLYAHKIHDLALMRPSIFPR